METFECDVCGGTGGIDSTGVHDMIRSKVQCPTCQGTGRQSVQVVNTLELSSEAWSEPLRVCSGSEAVVIDGKTFTPTALAPPNLAERVAEAIRVHNTVITVLSPNVVYLGDAEYYAALRDGLTEPGKGDVRHMMGLRIVRVQLGNWLQVARV